MGMRTIEIADRQTYKIYIQYMSQHSKVTNTINQPQKEFFRVFCRALFAGTHVLNNSFPW